MIAHDVVLNIVQIDNQLVNPVWYLGSAALLALIPIAVGLLTSYIKISIVLGVIKNALGTQHAPSAMVTLALSLALTGLTMNPVINETLQLAKGINIAPLSKASPMVILDTLKPLLAPWRNFMLKNTGKRELAALGKVAPKSSSRVLTPQIESNHHIEKSEDLSILLPAFILTELKEGFSMAFIVLLPFLAIDLIISNLLMGLGMMMVSPVLIALPIKLILFVLSDSWLLIAQSLIRSYQI